MSPKRQGVRLLNETKMQVHSCRQRTPINTQLKGDQYDQYPLLASMAAAQIEKTCTAKTHKTQQEGPTGPADAETIREEISERPRLNRSSALLLVVTRSSLTVGFVMNQDEINKCAEEDSGDRAIQRSPLEPVSDWPGADNTRSRDATWDFLRAMSFWVVSRF